MWQYLISMRLYHRETLQLDSLALSQSRWNWVLWRCKSAKTQVLKQESCHAKCFWNTLKKQEDLPKHSSIHPTPVDSDSSGMSGAPMPGLSWYKIWLLCFPACRYEMFLSETCSLHSPYLEGVMMCLMHQDELFAPRWPCLGVFSKATPVLYSVSSSTSTSQ